MKLSPRLKAIAEMVPANSKVADIGTDHAYIPIFLLHTGRARWAVASDINTGPLQRAKEVIEQHRLQQRIDTRLGDGLAILGRGEVDTVILAGMGGMLIRDVLQADQRVLQDVQRLVLQPMNAQQEVRKWLIENGYAIVDETLARERDRVYQIIAAEHGQQSIDDPIYFEIGKKLIEKNHPLLLYLLDKKMDEYRKIITGLKNSTDRDAAKRIKDYEVRLKRMRGVMQHCMNRST